MERLEKQLEIATKNFMQFGGELDKSRGGKYTDEREQRRSVSTVCCSEHLLSCSLHFRCKVVECVHSCLWVRRLLCRAFDALHVVASFTDAVADLNITLEMDFAFIIESLQTISCATDIANVD